MSVTGPIGGPPVRCGVSVADIAAGMFAASASSPPCTRAAGRDAASTSTCR
jgi:hypothetical protein